MYLMTQIAVYQHKDGTLGYGFTNDLWSWYRSTKSKFDGITLIAVFPIAWQHKTTFLANINQVLKEVKQGTNSYKISVDNLYKLFSDTIRKMKTDTYIPSTMIETYKSIPKSEVWNFDYTPTKMFEIRVNA